MTAPAASPATATAPSTDPIDSLDLSDVVAPVDLAIPEHMMLGGKPPEPDDEDADDPAVETTKPAAKPESQLPEGWKKDTLGRVHRPDGKIASKEEVASLATPTTQPEAAKPEKFRYRSGGQSHEPEGFEYNPTDGSVMVKPEQVNMLRDAMNARHVLADGRDINAQLRAENLTLKQQAEHRGKASTEEVARANALVEHYSSILGEPDEAKAIEAFFKLRGEYPILLAKASESYWKEQAQRGQPPERSGASTAQRRDDRAGKPVPSSLPPREVAVKHTKELVEQLKLDHAYRDFTPESWTQLGARYERTPFAFLRPATAEDVQKYDVEVGEIVFDTDAFTADVTEYATTLRSARETAESRAKLAADNARRTTPSVSAPPTPGGGTAPKKAPKGITSKEDLEDWWESPDI